MDPGSTARQQVGALKRRVCHAQLGDTFGMLGVVASFELLV
jgi:hypothetical protein